MKRLSEADRRAWDAYRQHADPLEKPSARVDQDSDPPRPKPAARDAVPAFRLGQASRPSTAIHDLAPSIREAIQGNPIEMDRKTWQRLRSGKLKPEAKLDLHGMTLDQAHPALMDFVMGHHAMGRRLLLVVTGKGKSRDEGGPIPTRFGVLRHQVPQWLRMPPLAPRVLQVAQAHQRHGGLGAYYVYLRRSR